MNCFFSAAKAAILRRLIGQHFDMYAGLTQHLGGNLEAVVERSVVLRNGWADYA